MQKKYHLFVSLISYIIDKHTKKLKLDWNRYIQKAFSKNVLYTIKIPFSGANTLNTVHVILQKCPLESYEIVVLVTVCFILVFRSCFNSTSIL